MDLSRLSPGEQIAGGAGVVLILSMFIFDWFGIEGAGAGNAWEVFSLIDIVLFLAGISAIGLAVIKASGESVALPVPMSVIVVVLGGIATLLMLFRLISPPDFGIESQEIEVPGVGTVESGGVDVDTTREFGAFLGFILTAILTYGAYLAMQEEGSSFGDVGGGRDVGGPGDRDVGGGGFDR
jgi:hypothetical protein